MRLWINGNRNQGTQRAYESGWRGFAKYLEEVKVAEHCIEPADIAGYLRQRVEEQGVAMGTVNNDRAAIGNHLRQYGQQELIHAPLVVDVINVLRTMAAPSKPKIAMPQALMLLIIREHDADRQRQSSNGSWKPSVKVEWIAERNIFLMLLMMMAFLRESEAAALRRGDVRLHEVQVDGAMVTLLRISIAKSKTDQEGIGQVILLGANRDDTGSCPLARFERYMGLTRACAMEGEFFFPTHTGTGMCRSTPCGIVQRAVEAANTKAERSGSLPQRWGDPMEYGSHSLRRGGVTTARSNGVSMLDIQRHGRWKSLTVFAYVGRTAEEQTAVTRAFLTGSGDAAADTGPEDDRTPPSQDVQRMQQAQCSAPKVAKATSSAFKRPRGRPPKQQQDQDAAIRVPKIATRAQRKKLRKDSEERANELEQRQEEEEEQLEDAQFTEEMNQGFEEEQRTQRA
jgi:integrase